MVSKELRSAATSSKYRPPGLFHPIGGLYYMAGAVAGVLQGLWVVSLKYTFLGRMISRAVRHQNPRSLRTSAALPDADRFFDAVVHAWAPSTYQANGCGLFPKMNKAPDLKLNRSMEHEPSTYDQPSTYDVLVVKEEGAINAFPAPHVPKPRRPSVHSFPVEFEEDLESIDEDADMQPQADTWGLRRPPLSPLSPSSFYKLSTTSTPSKLPAIPASPSGSYASAASNLTGDTGFDVFKSSSDQNRSSGNLDKGEW